MDFREGYDYKVTYTVIGGKEYNLTIPYKDIDSFLHLEGAKDFVVVEMDDYSMKSIPVSTIAFRTISKIKKGE